MQRIQRFGDFNTVKQTALEHIAGNVLRQHSTFGRNAPQEFLVGGDDEQSAAKQQSPAPSRTSGAGGAAPLECITEEASSASHSAAVSPSTSLRNEAPMLTKQDSAVSATAPPSVHQTYGLLEHMMVSDGTVRPPPLPPFCTPMCVPKRSQQGAVVSVPTESARADQQL